MKAESADLQTSTVPLVKNRCSVVSMENSWQSAMNNLIKSRVYLDFAGAECGTLPPSTAAGMIPLCSARATQSHLFRAPRFPIKSSGFTGAGLVENLREVK